MMPYTNSPFTHNQSQKRCHQWLRARCHLWTWQFRPLLLILYDRIFDESNFNWVKNYRWQMAYMWWYRIYLRFFLDVKCRMVYNTLKQPAQVHRRQTMVSYKPLFRYCLEHDISKVECRRRCGISPNTWTKINRNEEVSMSILNKICFLLCILQT